MKGVKFALLLLFICERLVALEFFVSPLGNDGHSGSRDAPFASIARAREAVRRARQSTTLKDASTTVWIGAGVYNQSRTFSLDERDSGTIDSPVTYAAMTGQEVRITGSQTLMPSWFARVDSTSPVWSRLKPSARTNIYSIDLRAHGISDFGTLKAGGFHISRVAPLELFINGRPMTLARWPNRGEALERTVAVSSDQRFVYSKPEPRLWKYPQDVWMHGLWGNMWADFHVAVASIDTATNTVTLVKPPAQFGIAANQPYYAYNVLEELDQPEEYYLDRRSGILYLWPPEPISNSLIQASVLESPLVQLHHTKFVTLRCVTLEATRGPLLEIDDSTSTRIEESLLRNCGGYGAKISGTNNGIDSSEIVACGEEGVLLEGGVRASLTPGNNFVTNSRIHRIARLDWTYHPAIAFTGGCGNIASHNLIEDLPHAAIIFSGNNHRIEYNEIRRVCQHTEDVGAIYAGRSWGFRGDIIRCNFIHHILSDMEGPGPHGVYLDDGMSGVQVLGNVFYSIQGAATYYGGGRDNITKGNLMAFTQIAHCSGDYDRGLINNVPGSPWNFLERLSDDGVQYRKEPWLSAYPECAVIPDSWEAIQKGTWRNPENCVFSSNGGWSNREWTYETNFSKTGVFSVYRSMMDNDPGVGPMFDESASWDRSLRPKVLRSPINGFEDIQFGDIGPAPSRNSSSNPFAGTLAVSAVSATKVSLQWADDGDLPWQRSKGSILFQMYEPNGPWRTVQTSGTDCDYYVVERLAPSSKYKFQLKLTNSNGSTKSNIVEVQTLPEPPTFGDPIRLEAENAMEILQSIGKRGQVSVFPGPQVSGKCVTLFDPEDAVRISFEIPFSGIFRLGARVRSGGANLPLGMEFFNNGYEFRLDGSLIGFEGDPLTVSPRTRQFGVTYWGTMYSSTIRLPAGIHHLLITSKSKWAAIDYIEVAPLQN